MEKATDYWNPCEDHLRAALGVAEVGVLVDPTTVTRPTTSAVQLSFTLPVADGARAREAARLLVLQMGFATCGITHHQALDTGFTFFVAYGKTHLSIDVDRIEINEAAIPNT